MDIKDIYEVWDRFEKSSLSELKLSLSGDNLELKKAMEAVSIEEKAIKAKSVFPSEPALNEQSEKKEEQDCKYKEVKAPFVGTFYRSPSPETKAFVSVGDIVKKGDILGIIEAMKIMNEIASPFTGKIVEIRAEDSKMIEYNQVLYVLEETDV